MPKKYYIDVKLTSLEFDRISKFKLVREDSCINCGKCIKVCIYEVHKKREDDPRKMTDPIHIECRNCFRCIQECPRGALVKCITSEFKNLGDSYWKPDMILSIWKQSDDGKVPVSGAGYRGPFTGPGFDSMWTDMSEIVRPTRDGIHGREYISTSVDLGRKLAHLVFDNNNKLQSEIPKTVDIPIPVLFDTSVHDIDEKSKLYIAKAAEKLGTFALFNADDINPENAHYSNNIIPLLSHQNIDDNSRLIENSKIVEIEYSDELSTNFQPITDKIKKINGAIISIRVPVSNDVETTVPGLVKNGAEIIHIVANYHGRESSDPESRFIKDVLTTVHQKLIENSIRDEVTIIASGGIAMAEHVPKAIISGADLTAIDLPLLIALGYKINPNPEIPIIPPTNDISEKVGIQRVVNLIGAWHSQLLEVLGAMGMREVRRLRGDIGRAIFFENIEKETFGEIFKKK